METTQFLCLFFRKLHYINTFILSASDKRENFHQMKIHKRLNGYGNAYNKKTSVQKCTLSIGEYFMALISRGQGKRENKEKSFCHDCMYPFN